MRLEESITISLKHYKNIQFPKNEGVYCILALGDCTTALGGMDSWPAQLDKVLNAQNTGVRFKVINKGRTDTDTSVIVSKLDDLLNKIKPDMVVVMSGINDGIRDTPYDNLEIPNKKRYPPQLKIYNLTRKIYLAIVKNIKRTRYSRKSNISKNCESGIINNGNSYAFGKQYNRAEAIFKRKIEINPRDDEAYLRLARYYKKNGAYSQAVEALKKAIALDPKNYKAYIELGDCYSSHDAFVEAEETYQKAIELAPENHVTYMMLGYCYRDQRKHQQAEAMFKRAIVINPRSDWAYGELGNLYAGSKRCADAEKMYQKAIELDPRHISVYVELGSCYMQENKISELEELLEQAKKRNIYNDRLYALEALYYRAQGNDKKAEIFIKKANEFRAKYYNPVTYYNYRRIKKIVTERGIKFVCMQYPMRSIEPLKKIFDSNEDIIFVSNEKIFKEELKKARYEDLFVDSFGGEFGHATARGNRLIAENLADTIIKEVISR
ncbi:MAG: tetratricopeptide repeat protein [Patescibacteria group bacterium]